MSEKSYEEGLIIGLRGQLTDIQKSMEGIEKRLRAIEGKMTSIYAIAGVISLAGPVLIGVIAKSMGWI